MIFISGFSVGRKYLIFSNSFKFFFFKKKFDLKKYNLNENHIFCIHENILIIKMICVNESKKLGDLKVF